MFIQFRRFLLKKFCVQYLYRLILLISLAKNSIFCFFGAIRRQNSGQNRVPENAVKWGIPGKIKNAIFLLFAVKILVRQFEKPVNTGLGAFFPRNIYSTKIGGENQVFRNAGKLVLNSRNLVGIPKDQNQDALIGNEGRGKNFYTCSGKVDTDCRIRYARPFTSTIKSRSRRGICKSSWRSLKITKR